MQVLVTGGAGFCGRFASPRKAARELGFSATVAFQAGVEGFASMPLRPPSQDYERILG